MGSNSIASMAIGLGLMLVFLYFSSDSSASKALKNMLERSEITELYYVKSLLKMLNINMEEKTGKESSSAKVVSKTKNNILLTPEELMKYDGGAGSKGLYLALLGEVFDVEKGAQHYRPGGGYAFFAGKDATRAYITGDFSASGLTDDVTDMEAASLASLEDWLGFYKEEYKAVGKVIGTYYDEDGNPTEKLVGIRKKLSKSVENKYLKDKAKDLFPPCNSEWSQEKGSRVWCTKKSGGVDREWVGVPRELHIEGKDPRCVCVRSSGPPSSDLDSQNHKNHGDLDHPGLKEYSGCETSSESCVVKS